MHIHIQVVCRNGWSGKQLGAAPARQFFNDIGVLNPFVIARVGVAPVVAQARGIIEDLGFTERPGVFIRITFGVNVLKNRA